MAVRYKAFEAFMEEQALASCHDRRGDVVLTAPSNFPVSQRSSCGRQKSKIKPLRDTLRDTEA